MKVIIHNQFTEHAMSNGRKNSDKTTANHCRQYLHNCLHCMYVHCSTVQSALFSIRERRASTVLALSRAPCDLIMAPHVENRRSTAAEDAGARKCLWIYSYLKLQEILYCDLALIQIESLWISNLIPIESCTVKSNLLLLESNLHKWFNRDLNRIATWICPSLL